MQGTAGDRALTLIMLVAAVGLGIYSGSIDAVFLVSTTFIAAMLVLDHLGGLLSRVERRLDEPVRMVSIVLPSWLAMILVGTILLAAPLATSSAVPDYRHNFWLHVGHSAFASVSAGCLVGLSTYSYGENYSFFGQAVILAMTQLSGMAFALIGLAIVRPFLRRTPTIRGLLFSAVLLQAAAVSILMPCWRESDAATIPERLWFGVVHATSALWNSGWMLRTDGLVRYLDRPVVFVAVTLLALAGSLGLPILYDLMAGKRRDDDEAVHRAQEARPIDRPVAPWRRLAQWEALAALFVIVLSAGSIFVWETPRFLPPAMVPARPVDFGTGRVSIRDDMPHAMRWTMSVFTAVTARSAGLQSMPLSEGAVSWPTCGLLIGLMTLGGSAAGTAGGFRLTSIVVILMCVLAPRLSWTSHPGGYASRRMLLKGCLRVLCVYAGLSVLAVTLLFLTTEATAYERVFDAVSATSNVGMSTSISLHLTVSGRLSMMLLMIAGRWVPLILWLMMSQQLANDTRRH